MHKRLQTELPGKVLPPLPRKNKTDTSASAGLLSPRLPEDELVSDGSSVSSHSAGASASQANGVAKSMQNLKVVDHRRNKSATSIRSFRSARSVRSDRSPRPSMDNLATSLPSSPKPEVGRYPRKWLESC